MINSCNDSLEEDDNIPDFDGCIGCSKYDKCHYEDEENIEEDEIFSRLLSAKKSSENGLVRPAREFLEELKIKESEKETDKYIPFNGTIIRSLKLIPIDVDCYRHKNYENDGQITGIYNVRPSHTYPFRLCFEIIYPDGYKGFTPISEVINGNYRIVDTELMQVSLTDCL